MSSLMAKFSQILSAQKRTSRYNLYINPFNTPVHIYAYNYDDFLQPTASLSDT